LIFFFFLSNSNPPGESLLNSDVLFLPSISEAQRSFLLGISMCLLYTPSNEHFGIVPCEAMASHVPVIAVNSGGPLESIGSFFSFLPFFLFFF